MIFFNDSLTINICSIFQERERERKNTDRYYSVWYKFSKLFYGTIPLFTFYEEHE